MFKRHDHCWHKEYDSEKIRTCCKCGRQEILRRGPIPGHGPYFESNDSPQWVKYNWDAYI